MMARRSLLRTLLAVGATVPAAACNLLRDHDTLKFRMTIAVDTPQGVKTGASVMQAVMKAGYPIYGAIDPGTYYVRGEAPFVDLGGGRFLFATLGEAVSTVRMLRTLQAFLAYSGNENALPSDVRGKNWRESFPEARSLEPSGSLEAKDYPFLVTFADVTRPETVRRVDPSEFVAVFGPGYALRDIRIEIVGWLTSLTKGFEDRFPQIADHKGLFGRPTFNAPPGAELDLKLQSQYFVRRD